MIMAGDDSCKRTFQILMNHTSLTRNLELNTKSSENPLNIMEQLKSHYKS